MKRATIAPAVTSVALAALSFFGFGGLAIGVLQTIGADAVAKATGSSARDTLIGGIAITAIGVALLWWTFRQWRAIVAIRVDDDGAWWLEPRAGAAVKVPPGESCELQLYNRRIAYTFGASPRIRDLVDGWVTAGGVTRKLAPSGPRSYQIVLDTLGLADNVPERGHRGRYPRRAA